jgi:uncharacterized phage protein (TIGR02218 family)
MNNELKDHLKTGLTTTCHAWAIVRKDGTVYGFTDHDLPLSFEGIMFKADTGLSAVALHQSTGLSIDNTEAMGALSDAAIREDDIEAGRFDGADVRGWLVNWANPDQRWLQFRGSIGELRRAGGAFQAELRGLTEALNRPLGRVYQKPCTAVLGDKSCRFDLATLGYAAERIINVVEQNRVFKWSNFAGFDEDWFTRGRLIVVDGTGAGLHGIVKNDETVNGARIIELWEPIRAQIGAGQTVRLEAGCDKRSETCRLKFNNYRNYQGFPDIPGEDWIAAYPKSSSPNTGGSLR